MCIRRSVAALTAVAALLSTAVTVLLPARPARADVMHFMVQFENTYSRKCLDLLSWTADDGSPTVQWNCLPLWAGATKQWFDDVAVNYYVPWPLRYHVHAWDNPKCLEVAAFDTSDTALISQHDCNGGPHQNWRFLQSRITGPPALASAYADAFLIQNEYTGACLTVADPRTDNNVAIVQRPCYTGGLLQLWWLHYEDY